MPVRVVPARAAGVRAVAPGWSRPPRSARPARPVPIRWLGARALLLHATLILVVPVCLLAGWWQVQRALAGNTLSFVYVFEWPAFAGVAVWAWWVLLCGPARAQAVATPDPANGAGGSRILAARAVRPRWDPATESPALQAYNAYLADIHAHPPQGRAWARPIRRGRRGTGT